LREAAGNDNSAWTIETAYAFLEMWSYAFRAVFFVFMFEPDFVCCVHCLDTGVFND